MSHTIKAVELTGWRSARKAKSIKAKPMGSMLVDQTVLAKFMLATLEGTQQNIQPDSMVCVGPDDDVWQQTRPKLLRTYDVTEITADGWLICTPKTESDREAVLITDEMLNGGGLAEVTTFLLPNAQWGSAQSDGSFAQMGNVGDYVVRSRDNPQESWIVAKRVFDNTYEFISGADSGAESSRVVVPLRA